MDLHVCGQWRSLRHVTTSLQLSLFFMKHLHFLLKPWSFALIKLDKLTFVLIKVFFYCSTISCSWFNESLRNIPITDVFVHCFNILRRYLLIVSVIVFEGLSYFVLLLVSNQMPELYIRHAVRFWYKPCCWLYLRVDNGNHKDISGQAYN